VFVCDIRKAGELMGWTPQIGVSDGVRDLIRWVRENRELFDFLKG
jgi:nucleoside-diphosphate-sugar epimerase